MYVLAGPADLGNTFGYCKPGGLAAGRFAIVEDDEYANGGDGPSTVDGRTYSTREEAEAALQARRQDASLTPGGR